MNTRVFRICAAMTVLAFIVAACGPAATPVPPTPVPPTQAPQATKPPAPTAAPTAVPPSPTVAPTKIPLVADLKGRQLKVGSDTTYPPFEFVDTKTNRIVGFDVDLVNEICKLINCKATFITTNYDTIFVALSQKQFDMVASGSTITDERQKTVNFSDSYLKYGETLLVRAGDTTVKTKDDLKNVKIIVGVQTGTSNEQTALKLVADQKKQVKRYDAFDQAVAALIAGDINCVEIDQPAALGYMATNPGKLMTVKDEFTSDDLGFAFQKGDKELLDAFNAGLKAVRANGTYDKIKDFWFNKWTTGAPIP
jgi:polar amino acid transport system substrate-binding protein